jgi:serine/threonine protein kinase
MARRSHSTTPVGITPADAVAVAHRVAEAVGAAHARGLVHRDIEPENILLASGDLHRRKVIDFGLVRRASGDTRLPVARGCADGRWCRTSRSRSAGRPSARRRGCPER